MWIESRMGRSIWPNGLGVEGGDLIWFFYITHWYGFGFQWDTCFNYSRGEDFRWKVCDVGGDGPACQELSHLVGEGVAVVLKQAIPVTSEQGQGRSQLMFQETAFTPLRNKFYSTCMCFLPGKKGNPWRSLQTLLSLPARPLCPEGRASFRPDRHTVDKKRKWSNHWCLIPHLFIWGDGKGLCSTKIHTSEDEMCLTYYPLMGENKTDCKWEWTNSCMILKKKV